MVKMTASARSDAENLKQIEAIRPEWERLAAERIRNEADIKRLAAEYEEAKRVAEEELGTSDEGEIREMITQGRTENTEAADEFVAGVRAVQARLAEIDGGRA